MKKTQDIINRLLGKESGINSGSRISSEKDFRNYIHPRQQLSQNFNPDMHTAKISWQVLQAAIADLTGKR